MISGKNESIDKVFPPKKFFGSVHDSLWHKVYNFKSLSLLKVGNILSYIFSRVKSEESMKEKLKRKGFEVTLENALTKIYDAAGIRIICSYIDDVYSVVEMLKKYNDLKLIKEKDYIKNPKENGYRSYHLVFEVPLDIAGEIHPVFIEIQIRTIAMDFWSNLEHQMKYKHNIKNPELIVSELKQCADEIATTDIKMQAIRKMINNS